MTARAHPPRPGRAAVRRARPWTAAGACLLLAACSGLSGNDTSEAPAAPAAPAATVPYEASLTGVEDKDLADLLRQSSELVTLQDRPPYSMAGLNQRAETDVGRLDKALRSEGFYAARVTYSIDTRPSPDKVVLKVDTGPVYLLEDFVIDYVGGRAGVAALPDDLEKLGLHVGMQARAKSIVDAQQKLLRQLGETGRPLAKVVERKVTVDNTRTTMTVVLKVDPGPAATFGAVTFKGLKTVDPGYLRRLVPWKPGAVYDSRKVEALRQELVNSNLFDGITLHPAKDVTADGRLPVTAELKEAKPRSVGGNITYSTEEGFSVGAFWEHRNLFGQAETLNLSTTVGRITQKAAADFRKPNFLLLRQDLLANASLLHQKTDAYNETGVTAFVGLERRVGDYWRNGYGLSADWSDIKENGATDRVILGGLPVWTKRDSTDDPLNPTHGNRLSLRVTPYTGSVTFLKTEAAASQYFALDKKGWYVLAGRVKLGSIIGASTATIPANKRFYAGGGGSIRGYGFQSVGPLDGATPIGGRSVFEVGAETRIRITDSLGFVPFIDGGSAFDHPYPTDLSNIRWGTGLGFRYYTVVGPIRLDVAFPLDRRKDIDSAYEIYVSLGQAF